VGRPWYVSYRKDTHIVMVPAEDRFAAVNKAGELLGQGADVIEVGPMLDPPENRIDAATLREIFSKQRTPEEQGGWPASPSGRPLDRRTSEYQHPPTECRETLGPRGP
jgi:hypothetical protein